MRILLPSRKIVTDEFQRTVTRDFESNIQFPLFVTLPVDFGMGWAKWAERGYRSREVTHVN